MFYSHHILTKKGPLGKVWIAATLGESRVPKAFATSANIHVLCRDVEHPAAPFALRLSASLLLGITRVYSRKSSIILSDVNSVYHLLSTTLTALQQQNTSRKRARPNVAHVSEITMSTTTAVKKQRLGVGNGMDLDLDAGTLMQESELERDILHAMHHTLLLHENAPVIHGMPFYASERDITIEAGSDNHSASLGLSLGDYNSSLEDVRRPLFHDDEHAEIEQGNGQQVTAGEGRRGQLPMTREAEHEERELLLLTPVDMKPLQLPTMPRHERHGTDSASGSARREKHSVLGSPPQQRGAELAQDALENNPVNDLLLDGDFGPLPPLDGFDDINLNTNPLQPSTAVAEPVALPQPQSQPQPEIELQPQPQPQPRKSWRGGAVVIDDQTEITVRDFRATLHDTSDIVNTGAAMFDLEAPRRTRSRSRRSSGTEHHVEYTLPSFFSRFAAEVRDLWQETVGDGMRRTDEEEGDGKGDTSTVGTIRGWRNNRKQPTVKDRHESSRTVVDNEEQDGGRVLDEVQIDFPSVQLEDEVYQEQQQQTELRGLSAEKMREGEGEGDGNIDAPSGLGSSAGGTGSGGARVSSLSAGASTNERQRVSALSHDRDRLFDFITPQDRRTYDRAREVAVRARTGTESMERVRSVRSGEGIPLPQAFDSDSESAGTERRGEEEHAGRGMFDVNTSEFQLEEETERAAAGEGDDEKGPIEAIGIRAFKMLQILRERIGTSDHGVKFDDLMEGCSRSVRARAFYNVLCLVNARFVRAEQSGAFATITVYRGLFF